MLCCTIYTQNANAAVFQTTNGELWIEAENASLNSDYFYKYPSTWIEENFGDVSGYTGGYCVKASDGVSGTPGNSATHALSLDVTADEAGTYSIWMRVYASTVNKSLYYSINNSTYKYCAIGAPKEQWFWLKVGIAQGIHASGSINLRIFPNTESFYIDKFCLTKKRTYTPTGSGTTLTAAANLTSPYNTPAFTPPAAHPRLLMRESDIPQIYANRLTGKNATAWNRYVTNRDTVIDGILPASSSANSNETYLGIIESYAFAYAVEGNTQLGNNAISALKNYIDTVVYENPYTDEYTRPAGYLIYNIAEVYDWCYPLMTASDKNYFIDAAIGIASNGMEIGWPPNKLSALTSHGSEAQLLRDLLAFSIAVYDERPDIYNYVAGRFFDEYVPSRNFFYPGHFFHQGTGYMSFRMQWDYMSAWIFKRMGAPEIYSQNQRYSAYWAMYMQRPDGVKFTEGDSTFTRTARVPGVYYNGMHRLFMLSSNYYSDGFLKQSYNDASTIVANLELKNDTTTPVLFLLLNDPGIQGEALTGLPLVKYFDSPGGQMIARTGWEHGLTSDNMVVQMKIGEYYFDNHQHLDFGNFQIYYKGLLAGDSGRYGVYGDSHDLSYYKRSVAHNTMLVYNPSDTYYYHGNQVINDGGQRFPATSDEQPTAQALIESGENKYGKVLAHAIDNNSVPSYSYIKGDLTKAYSSNTVSDYQRSFMFYNFKNEETPGALIVFDRVSSTNANYKKSWLLHGVVPPTVDGNRSVFRNNENGYNGKLTVDTLLPMVNNTNINVVGGYNNEFYVNGTNYPASTSSGALGGAANLTRNHDTDGYRIEVSPIAAQTTDYFLNVLQVGDCDTDTEPLPVELIETDTYAGAMVGERVAIFSKNEGKLIPEIDITIPQGDAIQYYVNVADVVSGTWMVKQGNNVIKTVTVTDESGILSFEGTAGDYTITDAAVIASQTGIYGFTGYNPTYTNCSISGDELTGWTVTSSTSNSSDTASWDIQHSGTGLTKDSIFTIDEENYTANIIHSTMMYKPSNMVGDQKFFIRTGTGGYGSYYICFNGTTGKITGSGGSPLLMSWDENTYYKIDMFYDLTTNDLRWYVNGMLAYSGKSNTPDDAAKLQKFCIQMKGVDASFAIKDINTCICNSSYPLIIATQSGIKGFTTYNPTYINCSSSGNSSSGWMVSITDGSQDGYWRMQHSGTGITKNTVFTVDGTGYHAGVIHSSMMYKPSNMTGNQSFFLRTGTNGYGSYYVRFNNSTGKITGSLDNPILMDWNKNTFYKIDMLYDLNTNDLKWYVDGMLAYSGKSNTADDAAKLQQFCIQLKGGGAKFVVKDITTKIYNSLYSLQEVEDRIFEDIEIRGITGSLTNNTVESVVNVWLPESPYQGNLIVAVYDGNELKSVKIESLLNNINGEFILQIPVTSVSAGDTLTIKAFIINMQSLAPLTKSRAAVVLEN